MFIFTAKFLLLIFAAYASLVFAESSINQDRLRLTEARGTEIYLRDRAAWLATDAVTIDRLQSANVRGWVTVWSDGQWVVKFISNCEDGFCAFFDVSVDLKVERVDVLQHPEPIPLDGKDSAAWRARQLAMNSNYRPCSKSYNTVVLEGDEHGEPVWLVYLLAATTDANVVVIGGHHRIMVDAEGRNVIRAEALSKSCLSVERDPDAVAMTVTHILDTQPIETHVFTSLQYEAPLYVGTSAGVFAIEGSRIRVVEER